MAETKGFFNSMVSADGNISSMRVIFLASYALVVTVPLIVWTVVSLFSKPMQMADFPANLVWFIGTVIAVITGGKVAQSFEEFKTIQNTPEDKPTVPET